MATRQWSYSVEEKLSFIRRLKEEFGSNVSFVLHELGIDKRGYENREIRKEPI